MSKYKILHIPSSCYLPIAQEGKYYTYSNSETASFIIKDLAESAISDIIESWNRLCDENNVSAGLNEDISFVSNYASPVCEFYYFIEKELIREEFKIVEIE